MGSTQEVVHPCPEACGSVKRRVDRAHGAKAARSARGHPARLLSITSGVGRATAEGSRTAVVVSSGTMALRSSSPAPTMRDFRSCWTLSKP